MTADQINEETRSGHRPMPGALPLILASASPRRRELLGSMGLCHEVAPASVEEWEATDADPGQIVLHNARLKAEAVAASRPDALVLAADTAVALDGHVFHKPRDLDEARAMLRRLAGRTHVVHTGVSLRSGEPFCEVDFVETSQVRFRQLDAATIEAYFAVVDPLDKAGAYGIQEGRELIIEDWCGSLHNIMGLPTERLQQVFEQQGLWQVLRKKD